MYYAVNSWYDLLCRQSIQAAHALFTVKGEILERRRVGWVRVLQRHFVSSFSVDDFRTQDLTQGQKHKSGWDIHDTVYSRELLISNRTNGYRDVIATIDLSTFRRIPWENNVPFFLLSFLDPDTKEPISVDPRGVLKRVTHLAREEGYECYSGVEYEVRE